MVLAATAAPTLLSRGAQPAVAEAGLASPGACRWWHCSGVEGGGRSISLLCRGRRPARCIFCSFALVPALWTAPPSVLAPSCSGRPLPPSLQRIRSFALLLPGLPRRAPFPALTRPSLPVQSSDVPLWDRLLSSLNPGG